MIHGGEVVRPLYDARDEMVAAACIERPAIVLEGTVSLMNGRAFHDPAPTYIGNDLGVEIQTAFDCTPMRQRNKRRPIVVLLPLDARERIAKLTAARLKSQQSVASVFSSEMFAALKALLDPAKRADVRGQLEAAGFYNESESSGEEHGNAALPMSNPALDAALAEVERSITRGTISHDDSERLEAMLYRLRSGGAHPSPAHSRGSLSESFLGAVAELNEHEVLLSV